MAGFDWDDWYAVAAHVPGAEALPARWAADAAAFRARLGSRTETYVSYGGGPRQWFDLLLPEGPPKGLGVFVHGGYWVEFDPRAWSHLAAGMIARGLAVAMPCYTLAPAARLAGIGREVAAAINVAAGRIDGPIHLAGHSAGGHLVARMAAAGSGLAPDVAARITRVVPISPLSDLRPLMRTKLNDDLQLDLAEARAESPALLEMAVSAAVMVWVGGDERPSFLDQARWLAQGWPQARLHVEPGRHHFDVIDALADPASGLTAAVCGSAD